MAMSNCNSTNRTQFCLVKKKRRTILLLACGGGGGGGELPTFEHTRVYVHNVAYAIGHKPIDMICNNFSNCTCL